MDVETIGKISGLLVAASVIPYGIRTYQGKVHPNLTSWSLWTLIGLVLLLTYKSSGAEDNLWPAIFGFTNPALITLLVIKRRDEWTKPNQIEKICVVFSLLSFGLWIGVHKSKELAQYALYLAIVADFWAAIPTIKSVWTQPDDDRPFAWGCFATGYGLAIFAVPEHTFANYALPVWMFFGASSIGLPLALYRWKQKIPLKEWM